MKATGLSWCPMIPDNWEVLPAKEIFFKNKRDITDTDEVVTCFRDGEVTLRKNRRSTGYTESEEYAGFQGVRVNDLVIHQMDAFAGAIGVSDSDGMCTSVYHCCTPIGNHDVHYFKYLLRYMAFSGYIASLSKGIRERSTDFSYNVFRRQLLIIPPYDEQKKIAAYLEEKIAAINATIAARDEELKLLKKFKQSKIAEVVTHGLTPNVPTKSSPLGQIPAHWEVLRLKNFATTIKGKAADYYDEPIDGAELVLSVEVLRGAASPALNYAVCIDPEQHCTSNDIVVIWDGAGVGEFLRAKEGLIASTTAKFVLDKKKIYSNFFWYFGGRVEEIQKNMPTGMGIPHVSPNILNNTEFAIPPFEEQVEISKYLDVECEKIDRKCKLIDEQIKKMQLLKRALINEVVTGKRQLA